MIKSFLAYTIAFTILLFCIYGFQTEFLKNNIQEFRYNHWDTNVFFAVSSLLICIHLKIFSSIKKLQFQLGFVYLPTIFIKGFLFFISFRPTVFSVNNLTISERLNLLIPLLLFVVLEVFFVSRVLKQINLKY